MAVWWDSPAESLPRPQVYAGLQVFAPDNYEVSYAQEFRGVVDLERSPDEVSLSNRVAGDVEIAEVKEVLARINMLPAVVRFRTQDFEPKLNFVLLLGGAVIGLGLTLLVESFIASLFRFQETVTRS